MQTQTVIFIGPQGSGKGTQVKNVIEHVKETSPDTPIFDIETGKLFRALAQEGGFAANRVKELLDNGQPVPDIFTNAMVAHDFATRYTEDAFITMDGFPRNKEQAQYLDELLSFYGRTQLSIVFLDTPEELVRSRMLGRGREDDTEENITQRLTWYTEMVTPMIAYYQQRSETNFVTVDGSQDINAVFDSIKEGLGL